jgi:hypothetical protein
MVRRGTIPCLAKRFFMIQIKNVVTRNASAYFAG